MEIAAAGFAVEPHRVISETVSSSEAIARRKGFGRLMEKLEPGDVLVVTRLDRLGRDAIDVMQTVARLVEFGVRVHCLALGGVDLTSSAGKMTMRVIGAVAQFERDLLIERTQAGLARARAEAKRIGRPPALTPDQQAAVRDRLEEGGGASPPSPGSSVPRGRRSSGPGTGGRLSRPRRTFPWVRQPNPRPVKVSDVARRYAEPMGQRRGGDQTVARRAGIGDVQGRAVAGDLERDGQNAAREGRQYALLEPGPQVGALRGVDPLAQQDADLDLLHHNDREPEVRRVLRVCPGGDVRIGTARADLAQLADDVRVEEPAHRSAGRIPPSRRGGSNSISAAPS